jgi:hypothetical protein
MFASAMRARVLQIEIQVRDREEWIGESSWLRQ